VGPNPTWHLPPQLLPDPTVQIFNWIWYILWRPLVGKWWTFFFFFWRVNPPTYTKNEKIPKIFPLTVSLADTKPLKGWTKVGVFLLLIFIQCKQFWGLFWGAHKFTCSWKERPEKKGQRHFALKVLLSLRLCSYFHLRKIRAFVLFQELLCLLWPKNFWVPCLECNPFVYLVEAQFLFLHGFVFLAAVMHV
jgi:hypothetical protein